MKKAQKRFIIFFTFFFVFMGIIGLILSPFMRDIQNPEYREAFSAWIAGLGFKGIVVFYLIQLLQNFTAVIPIGSFLQIVAGAAFGLWKGYFIVKTCFIISAITVFFVIRKFGNKLIIRLLGDDAMNTRDFLKSEKNTAIVTFILFFIPGLPKDTLTYLVAMTKFPLHQFLPITIVARFPAMFSGVLMGDAVMQGNWILFFMLFGISALVGLLGIQFRERIMNKVQRST
jgi:uncharacterized membrane protein YdjX (TVP38/TMEM64 family)